MNNIYWRNWLFFSVSLPTLITVVGNVTHLCKLLWNTHYSNIVLTEVSAILPVLNLWRMYLLSDIHVNTYITNKCIRIWKLEKKKKKTGLKRKMQILGYWLSICIYIQITSVMMRKNVIVSKNREWQRFEEPIAKNK